MDYGDIFKRGFLHTWHNKFIYLLGFLAALGGSSGAGASFNSNFNVPGGGFNPGSSPGDVEQFEEFFGGIFSDTSSIETMISGILGAVIAISCILMIFKIVMWFVRLIAEAGMIQAVSDLETGVKTNFKKAFADGRPHMLKFFLAKLTLFIIPFIVIFLALAAAAFTIIPIVSSGNADLEQIFTGIGVMIFPFVCLMCLLIPYNLIVSIIYPIAQRGIVFKGMDAMESLKHGWEVLKEKPSEILLFGFLYAVMGMLVSVAAGIVSLPIIFGTGWPVISTLFSGEAPSGGAFTLLGIGVILMIIIGSIVNAVFVSFRSSSFTLAYLQLEGKTMQEF